MKNIVFDTGPIISFAMNNLLWVIPKLQEQFKGEFLITKAVKFELVEKPMQTKKFKFQAHQVARLLQDNVVRLVTDNKIEELGKELAEIANNCYFAHNHPIKIVHDGELEAIACSILEEASAMVIDERTTRVIIEEPMRLRNLLERKLHTKIFVDKDMVKKLRGRISGINIIRSIELASVAFKMGLLDKFLYNHDKVKLLEAVLWGMKLSGCAVSEEEIRSIQRSGLV